MSSVWAQYWIKHGEELKDEEGDIALIPLNKALKARINKQRVNNKNEEKLVDIEDDIYFSD